MRLVHLSHSAVHIDLIRADFDSRCCCAVSTGDVDVDIFHLTFYTTERYGGNDPVQSSTAYLDRHYGLGEDTRQLLAGECP